MGAGPTAPSRPEPYPASVLAFEMSCKSMGICSSYPKLAAIALLAAAASPLAAATGTWQSVPFGGGNLVAIATAPSARGTVYGLSQDGFVYLSHDGAATWGLVGSTNMRPNGGQPPVLAVDPRQSATVYVGGGTGGGTWFLKSTDGGRSWSLAGPDPRVNPGLYCAQSAISGATFYCANGQEIGHSDDGGATWTTFDPGFNTPTALAIDPTNSQIVYLATNHVVVRSADGGASWNSPSFLFPNADVDGIFVDPNHPATVYATTAGSADSVWKSGDSGTTWTSADAGLGGPVYSSGGLAQGFPFLVAPSGTLYLAARVSTPEGVFFKVFRSLNGGTTWQLAAVLDTAVMALAADSGKRDALYAATTVGGALFSLDQAASWSAPARGPQTQWILQLLAGPGEDSWYGASSEDGYTAEAFWHSDDGGASWKPIVPPALGPYGFFLALGPTPGFLYLNDSQTLFVSTDGGGSWQDLHAGLPPNAFLIDLAASPLLPRHLYYFGSGATCGGEACPENRLEGSSNNGRRWSALALAPINSNAAAHIVTDPTAANTLYVAGSALLKSTDGGVTLHRLPVRGEVSSLAIDPAAPATLYVASTQPRPIFKSTDGGATWHRASLGLPAGTVVTALAIDPAVPSTLYAQTNKGIFVTDDAAGSWQPMNDGLQGLIVLNVIVSRDAHRTVYAGTRSTGLYALTRQ